MKAPFDSSNGAPASIIDRTSRGGARSTAQAAAAASSSPMHDRTAHLGRDPIYLQGWWWDVACGSRKKSIAVCEGGREVGRLLYFPRTRRSMGFCRLAEGIHAPWTNYCAPTIDQGANLDVARQGDIAHELALKLPRNMSYHLVCPHFTHEAVLSAFERAGFEIGTQSSYLVDLRGAATDNVIAHLDMSTRQRYRKAEKKLDVVEISPSMFFHLYRRNLAARARISYSDLKIAERLAEACRAPERRCIRITAAKTKDMPADDPHSYHAAIACLQDDAVSYYWMSTRDTNAADPDVRNGAVKLLIVDAMAHASGAGLIFDFDGTTTTGTSELYQGFRGTKVNRYVLTRRTRWARVIEMVRSVVSAAIARASAYNRRPTQELIRAKSQ
jgi:hypothetical protein